jgi:hypothetical protein
VTDFKVSKGLALPSDFALEVLAVLAKRGAGKTYDAAVVAEEMLKAGIPIVVIDGMGQDLLRHHPTNTSPNRPGVQQAPRSIPDSKSEASIGKCLGLSTSQEISVSKLLP